MTQQWQHAFVLHTRPYSETSLLLDLFTQQNGRVSVLAKGARRKRSAFRGLLQPFIPLIVNYRASTGLKTLYQVEAISLGLPLSKERLYSAFYLNELLVRVLEFETAYPDLFLSYLTALTGLAQESAKLAAILREFEYDLLIQLGYGIDFSHCATTGQAVQPEKFYQYRVDLGFCEIAQPNSRSFSGKVLLDFAARCFEDPITLSAAKYFIKMALHPYIGDAPFKSRELFQLLRSS